MPSLLAKPCRLRVSRPVRLRSYRHSGRADCICHCCYECRQRSQFTKDNAEPSFLPGTNSLLCTSEHFDWTSITEKSVVPLLKQCKLLFLRQLISKSVSIYLQMKFHMLTMHNTQLYIEEKTAGCETSVGEIIEI